MTDDEYLLNEDNDDVNTHPLGSFESEMNQIKKLQVMLNNKTRKAQDDFIKQLQGGMGEEMKKVVSNPELYALKPTKKPFSVKVKEFFKKLFRVL